MEKIKTGLAAFGMSGQIFHAPFISTNPAFCLTAITERNKNLSKERYPSARIVRSFEELVALDELELVVINTPDSTHYEYTRKALEAGKNVIVEKPFTATAEQGQELVDLARSKGLAISVYQNRRWDSDFLTVREILNKGLLGRLVEFESTFPRYRNFIKPGKIIHLLMLLQKNANAESLSTLHTLNTKLLNATMLTSTLQDTRTTLKT